METMSRVRVSFAGVAALGPGCPGDPPYERDGPFYAIFPASTRRKTVREDALRYIPFHLPVIITDTAPASDSRPSDDEVDKRGGGKIHVWYPLGERLIFVIDGGAAGNLTYEHVDADTLPDGDVNLLADMRLVWREVSIMPPNAMATAGPKSNEAVHGQVFIPFGRISSGTSKPRKPVVFDPKRTTEPVRRSIVPEAVVAFEARHRVEIRSTSLDTGLPLDTISFDIKGDIEIRIANADPRDIRKTIENPAFEKGDRPAGKADADFELYYTILAPGEKRGLPVPVDSSEFHLVRDCYVLMTDVLKEP
jgi:hypothetical protein